MILRVHSALIALLLIALPGLARADYQTEKDNRNLDVVQRALDKFQPDPSIFDGKKITEGASVNDIKNHFGLCNNGVTSYTKYFKQVSAKGQATPRARELTKRAQERQKYCVALATAGDAYIKKVTDAANAAAAAKKANEEMCFSVYREASKALGTNFHEVLDTSYGRRTMATGEHMTEYRTNLETLAGVCQKPAYAKAPTDCKNIGILQSSATNARYDYSDICKPAVDVNKTLTEAVMRSLDHLSQDHQHAPDLRAFKLRDGWLRDQNGFTYATFFKVTDKTKEMLLGRAKPLFEAAGVPVPADLSGLWEQKQAYLDTMKGLVDQTINDWQVTGYKNCKGYGCNLAKKSLTKEYKQFGGAKIKKVFGSNNWKIHKNALGVPLERSVSITIVFQVKGDPSCQARSFSLWETYKGGGRYQKAKGVKWGYGRFQKCQ